MFYPIFCLRRFIFIFFCLKLDLPVPIMFVIILLINQCLLTYIGFFKPLTLPLHCRLEMFNEYMICFITPLIIPFANQWYSHETKISYGWIMIGFIFSVIGVNMFYVLRFGLNKSVLLFKRSFNRC
jgi:hypothetical protein